MKLTKREKKLLYFLALVAIVAGIQLLAINPAVKASGALDDAILEREQTSFQMQQTILTREASEKSLKESVEGIDEAEKAFLPVMTSEELDRYITGQLQTCGLVAESLTISDEVEQMLSEAIACYSVRVTARGSMTNFERLVEWARTTDGVRIADIDLVNSAETRSATPTPTATPKPTRTPKASKYKKKATPTPAEPTATPEPTDSSLFKMDITFIAAEYDSSQAASILTENE